MLRTLYALATICAASVALAVTPRTQNFDSDPGWEGVNNRIVPKQYPTVVQDFGYSQTRFAGKGAGEMGGRITRASEPAFYGDRIGPRTLDDKLSASGSFALTQSTGGAGMFFGFVRAEQPGAGGRPIGSLGLDFDCEKGGARLAVRLITAQNQSCGTFITPFIPGKFRPTPIRNDGTRYAWKLDYDPNGVGGRGQFTFTIHGDAPKPGELESPDMPDAHRKEARSRFPSTTTFTVDLPEGFKRQGTTFDHFGAMNMMKPGGQMTIHFDDLEYDGRSQDFSQDPKWDGSGNRSTYQAKDVGGAHNFGFSTTSYAGGKAGEIGGTFWRAEKPVGRYGDRVGPLSLDDKLAASGKAAFIAGGPDSGMFIGWYNSKTVEQDGGLKDFLGVRVEGPTRVGHYFAPVVAASAGLIGKLEKAPVLVPGKESREWSIEYDPNGNGGNGAVTVRLDGESATLNLKPAKDRRATFDRFGVFTPKLGGQMVKLYLDDLTYTAESGR